jgi:hypothetical protein
MDAGWRSGWTDGLRFVIRRYRGWSTAVRFSLPDSSSQLFSETKVSWRGQRGLVELAFQSLAVPQKSELQEWLSPQA